MWNKLVTALLTALFASSALAVGRWVDVEVYDRRDGRYLQVYPFEGRHYIAGRPGAEYEIVLRNRSGERVLAVASVDGINVVSGETASPAQAGYVLEPYGSMGIKGWRKNMGETASFYFTEHRHSYAARTDRPFDVGVIGVAVFRERPRPLAYAPDRGRYKDAPAAAMEREEKLGTGHGRREESRAEYTRFERASSSPDEIVAVYYDTWANLAARGIVPRPTWRDRHEPQPFPQRFAPDPWR
ncbi:hypothetical protein BURK2_01294 [Burkholderiales bacterium]|nr:MAG: hypothetical protein F9K47_09630 [Burkholderiales bacterium]CAG0971115.1 hypothetical protein BURK2_01294 [Burkholderiales bacterium]